MSKQKFVLRKNDRIVFLGDSITEQHLYTNYVQTFLTLRYPQLNLTFFNAGWGGDQVDNAIVRLPRDVFTLAPTIVTICLGMNDGLYSTKDDKVLAKYKKGMQQLVAILKQKGIRPVLLTPGCVDEDVNQICKKAKYNDGMLRAEANIVMNIAREEEIPCFDIFSLMLKINRIAKKHNPSFTMIPDGVHPDPAGHLVMAYGLLRALGVPLTPRKIKINLFHHKAKQYNVNRGNDVIQITLKLPVLPFFIDPLARKVLPYFPFMQKYNSIVVSIDGKDKTENCYLLSSNGRIDCWTAEQFRNGFNITEVFCTEPMQAAQNIWQYINGACQCYYHYWRSMALSGSRGGYYNKVIHSNGIFLSMLHQRYVNQLVATAPRVIKLCIKKSNVFSQKINNESFIRVWRLNGPFPLPYEHDYLGNEASFTSVATEPGTKWISVFFPNNPLSNCLNETLGTSVQCSAYALCFLFSPANQTAKLLLGSDDGFALWLNGAQKASRYDISRGAQPDQNIFNIRLKKGMNQLLLKITQVDGDWGFYVRFRGLKHTLTAYNTVP